MFFIGNLQVSHLVASIISDTSGFQIPSASPLENTILSMSASFYFAKGLDLTTLVTVINFVQGIYWHFTLNK